MLRLGHTLSILAILASEPAGAQLSAPTALSAPNSTGMLGPRVTSAEPQLNLWMGRAKSDNLTRSGTGTEGYYDSLGLLLGLGHDSTRLQARLNGDLEFRTYSVDDVDEETIGNLDGVASLAVIPNRFAWSFRGTRGQGIRDPFAPLGPLNREGIQTLGSGPVFDLPLGSRTALSFRGEYSSRRFDQSTNVDNDSTLYQVGLFRAPSRTARFGLQLSSNEVDYPDVSAAPVFQIDSASLRYEKTLATGRVIAALGRNEVDTGLSKDDGPLLEFEWARDLATRSSLSIRAGRRFTDSGSFLSTSSTTLASAGTMDIVVSASPVERSDAEVIYRLRGARTTAEVALGSADDIFLTYSTLDNDTKSASIAVTRIVSVRLSLNVAWRRLQREIEDPLTTGTPSNEDAVLSLWVNRSLGRRFNLAAILARYEREGAETFHDRRFELRLGYSPTQQSGGGLGLVGR
jgi:hypothetical protein